MSTPDTRRTYSDSIAGYITSYEPTKERFGLRTSDGREVVIHLGESVNSQIVRNLGDPARDTTGATRDMLSEGRYVFVYGIFYQWDGGQRIEARQITFPEEKRGAYVFEHPNWWVQQAEQIADFYLRGHFPDGVYDWRNFRTKLTLSGTHPTETAGAEVRQETDTISRLVYGLATAFMLTGEERFLRAAESGTEYLREHMRVVDEGEKVAYWYHAIDITEGAQRKVFASEFGDDYDAIPMYEQIYALAGPTQTYRITGDPRILNDIDHTVSLFEKYFRDTERGGFFSHLDPITMDPRSDSLGRNRSRKNWNSVGDHAPAYLINAYLATGRADYAKLLEETADTITKYFPDEPNSPFVQERFHADWSPDRTWGWQQDRAVVGHNLKIAWNLTRIRSLVDKAEYTALAERIAEIMPPVGSDQQRGGWYDVVERQADPATGGHRLVWHDRKAWWQQEQSILAYLILAGVSGDPEHKRLAREAAAFYNAFFLDYDDGGVYFNVLANGIPYLLGTERLKGSHSMAGYHALELCYLAATYTGLLVNSSPLTLHFRPLPESFPGRVLRVAPDLLPVGSIQIDQVWIDDQPYDDFDPKGLTVNLPESAEPLRVRVVVEPVEMRMRISSEFDGKTAHIKLAGVVDKDELDKFRRGLTEALSVRPQPQRVEFHLCEVTEMTRPAINELLFQRTKAGMDVDFVVVGCALPEVAQALAATDAFLLDPRETCES
ncbi:MULTISPECIES: AGE family epimerase/isomerase [Kitasatospora]|uniref:AGE family epimerase/isomerase n=1 Tax=Kitasatospora TaxID=2063 RepID=UPI000C709882|nr:AGE family epimerase/isomerase [Kitasatospora sp. GP30]MDH6138624.1 mannose/cellobiose epimerase-like protein (N-acyl-D-glucosamine 2-epimerase family) [Kitasatospora sp. GP30]